MKETFSSPDHSGDLESRYPDFKQASVIFEKFVTELPETLYDLRQSAGTHDIYFFRQLVEKLIPQLQFIGLSDLNKKLIDINSKCVTPKDMVLYEIDIQNVIREVNASKQPASRILKRLKEFTGSTKPNEQLYKTWKIS